MLQELFSPELSKYFLYSQGVQECSIGKEGSGFGLPLSRFPERKSNPNLWSFRNLSVILSEYYELPIRALKGHIIPTNQLEKELFEQIRSSRELRDFFGNFQKVQIGGNQARLPIPSDYRFIFDSNSELKDPNNLKNKVLFEGRGDYFILTNALMSNSIK